jgi:hypothetical protein
MEFTMKMNKWAGLVALAVVLFGAGQARADLIVNGGFETGDFTGWSLSGNTGFSGVASGAPFAHSGTYGAYFGAVGSDGILTQAQNVNTVVGHTYTFSFWLYNEGGTPNDMSASFGSDTVLSLTNAPAMAYTEFTYNVVATSTSTSVSFSFRQDPAYWGLDDVSLVDTTVTTPEPASLTMLGLGTMCLMGYAWRRKKKVAAA